VLAAREARRLDAGPAAKAGYLQPRVLAEDPLLPVDASSELGFGTSVLVVRRAGLRRILANLERLELVAREGAA
jgi:hypothetical protein